MAFAKPTTLPQVPGVVSICFSKVMYGKTPATESCPLKLMSVHSFSLSLDRLVCWPNKRAAWTGSVAAPLKSEKVALICAFSATNLC